MRIASCELNGITGHEAGRLLLARLYREETGEDLPPIAVTERGKPYFEASALHFFHFPHEKARILRTFSSESGH